MSEKPTNRPMAMAIPLREPLGPQLSDLYIAAAQRFSSLSTFNIEPGEVVTKVSLGEDGAVSIVDGAGPLEDTMVTGHPELAETLQGYPHHALLLAEAAGDTMLDRVIAGAQLMILARQALLSGNGDWAYWMASDQWVRAAEFVPFADALGDDLLIPQKFWVKLVAQQQGMRSSVQTRGLLPITGTEYVLTNSTSDMQVPLREMFSFVKYVFDPKTPLPTIGDTFGATEGVEYQLFGSSEPEVVEIRARDHGLVC